MNGMRKPNRTTFTDRDYRKHVRAFGEQHLANLPRRLARQTLCSGSPATSRRQSRLLRSSARLAYSVRARRERARARVRDPAAPTAADRMGDRCGLSRRGHHPVNAGWLLGATTNFVQGQRCRRR